MTDSPDGDEWSIWRQRYEGFLDRVFDWHWLASLAMLGFVIVVLISQWSTLRGWDEVLHEIRDNSSEISEYARAGACVDLLEEEFQRAISEVVIGLVEDDPDVLTREAPRLRAATSEAAVRACYAVDS